MRVQLIQQIFSLILEIRMRAVITTLEIYIRQQSQAITKHLLHMVG